MNTNISKNSSLKDLEANPSINKNNELSPEFEDLNPEIIQNHVIDLVKEKNTIEHSKILDQLLEQIEKLDFEELAFEEVEKLRKKMEELDPNSKEAKEIGNRLTKFKLNSKHYLILSIENLLIIAKKNNWGLCKNNDFIYLYNGSFWSTIDDENFQKFLGQAAEKMGVDKFSARYHLFKEKLYKQFLSSAALSTPTSDNDKVLINLQNGTFEINQEGTNLRKFNRKDFLTYQLPFSYNPEAKAPLFKKYLNQVLPDEESQKILAEYLGFVFIKNGNNTIKEEKALILYGTGANGKSVFFEIVNALLGNNNISNYSLQDLTNENGYYRAMIANKLINYASEINGKMETSIFKQMVSGEPVPARLPYGKPMELKQYAKLIFNCNELPKDVEHTNAYFRRFLIIPFNVTIPEKEQDKKLHNKIINNELSGVFNWVLEGLNGLISQNGFTDCKAADNSLEQYKTESNSVKLFLNEAGYGKDAEDSQLIKNLYPEYRAFCIEDGMTAFKKTNFMKQLTSLGFPVENDRRGNFLNISKANSSNVLDDLPF